MPHTPAALPRALLILRVTLGLFLLQWGGVEKFVVPDNTTAIWGHFYGLPVAASVGYLFGAVQVAVALCLFTGAFRTPAYGLALLMHTVTTVVTIPTMLDPWRTPASHLFIAGVPVWGAFAALFLLRAWDTLGLTIGNGRVPTAGSDPA